MEPHLRIEQALYQHQERQRGEDYFHRYAVVKQRLYSHEYGHVMAGFPYGNEHGPGHIERVLERLGELLGERPLDGVYPVY